MKKVYLWLIFVSMVILSLSLVSAQIDLARGTQQLIQWIVDLFGTLFQALLGGFYDSGEYLFERILFFMIMISACYVAISRVPVFKDRAVIIWIVTLSISLISTRFLTEASLIRTILLSYNVLVIAITAFLPFFIYFFFVHSFDSSVMRRIAWIFFLVVFIGVWWVRYSDFENYGWNYSWIYFFTGIVAGIFMLADGTVRRVLIRSKMRQLKFQRVEDFERHVRRQLAEAEKDYKNDIIDKEQYERIQRHLYEQLRVIRKN